MQGMDRSEVRKRMSAVRSKDTGPEMVVRRLAHSLGFRYRLHVKDLPGKPDLVFPRLRKIIMVHGCFWHGHDCVLGNRPVPSNRNFWTSKIHKNVERDAAVSLALQNMGWDVLTIWECELRDRTALQSRLEAFLRPAGPGDTTPGATKHLS